EIAFRATTCWRPRASCDGCAARSSRSPRPGSGSSMTITFLTRFFRFLNRPARTKRFEILLALNYNDGRLIEPEKFDQTAEDLRTPCGGAPQDTVRIPATGKSGATRYRDDLLRMRFDPNDPAANAFLKDQKEVWKKRFEQIDIGITAHEIEIICPFAPAE